MQTATAETTADEDPIAYFLEDQRYHGKSERTLDAYHRVLRRFEEWIIDDVNGTTVETADRRACMSWVHSLREDYEQSTIASYASYVNRFYGYMVQIGAFDRNPMVLVVDQMPEEIDANPVRRDISLEEMRGFVSEITHPLTNAIVITFLKTGIRVGELCNLDLRDLNLGRIDLDTGFPTPRAALDGRSNALFVDAGTIRGATVNGELRTASNKRKRSTIIPVDAELRAALIRWLAIRPDPISSAEPLFLDTADAWGQRMEPAGVRRRIQRHTEPRGWYAPGAGASENVTPHYFRHFFTTHMRDRTGDRGIVKYLRGDVADDVIETYTHNWGERVKRRYEANIYRLT